MNNKSKKKERNDSTDPAGKTNSKHKDTLFRCIFTFKKEWLLELYNAVNGTAYTNPDDITFTTIGDAVYIEMKNDISFLISEIMNFYEHQSTFNPNMPVRMLIYSGMAYSRYVEDKSNDFNLYGSRINKLPVPKCVCFYNGKTNKGDIHFDAFRQCLWSVDKNFAEKIGMKKAETNVQSQAQTAKNAQKQEESNKKSKGVHM